MYHLNMYCLMLTVRSDRAPSSLNDCLTMQPARRQVLQALTRDKRLARNAAGGGEWGEGFGNCQLKCSRHTEKYLETEKSAPIRAVTSLLAVLSDDGGGGRGPCPSSQLAFNST